MKTGYKLGKSTTGLAKGYDNTVEMKPTVSFTDKELPELAKWKVGKTYQLVMTVKQVSLSQDNYDGAQKHRASFEVVDVKPEEKE